MYPSSAIENRSLDMIEIAFHLFGIKLLNNKNLNND